MGVRAVANRRPPRTSDDRARWRSLRELPLPGVVLLACLAGCSSPRPPDVGIAPAAVPVDPAQALRDRLAGPRAPRGDLHRELAAVYAARGFRPLWYLHGRLTTNGGVLLAVLAAAAGEGLDAEDYLPGPVRHACGGEAVADPAGCDIRLGEGLLRYARDVRHGVFDAGEADPAWHIPQQRPLDASVLTAVAEAADPAAALADLPPPHAAYRRLRAQLAAYRAMRPWSPLPPGPALRAGDRGDRVARLRARLAVESTALPDRAASGAFDGALQHAVKVFQRRHGLEPDGVVGRATLAALNQPRDQRIAQLRTNLERWRWLPRDLGPRHLLVNLAGFDATLVDRHAALLSMRVIVGRADRSSPALADRIGALVINPPWTVPRRNAVEDLLPKQQADPLALAALGIDVLRREAGRLIVVDPASVDWGRLDADHFPFVLRQRPGPGNSLGRIKFDMRNDLDVYLHDTPARQLFDRPRRTFSSGCIRVERPLDLAARLLGGDLAMTTAGLRSAIEAGSTAVLPVDPPLPVYLVYFTAWVDDDGNLQLRDDVYGRNVRILDRFAFP